ncbi:MAG: hypothetical protein ABR574_02310 [Cryomorphaceae bacterium]
MFPIIPKIQRMTLPFAALVLFSCTINGSFQGLRSYYPESIKLNPDLFVHLDDGQLICDTEESHRQKVVIATAEQVKDCLQPDSSVVYIWGANCKGSFCKSLNESQEMANQARANLFIVAEYYDAELMDLNYKINHPIIGVDTEYYKSEWTKTYLSKFLTELAEEKTSHSGGRFLVFVDGEMAGRYRTMESALGQKAN